MNDRHNSIPRLLSLLVVLSVMIPAILSGPVQMALAATTAWFSPTANAIPGTGYNALTNPTNAYGDDTSYATGNLSSSSSPGQQYYGFGASIPSGAVLQGIEVRVDYYLSNTYGTNTLYVELSTDGSNWTTAASLVAEPTTQSVVYLQPADPLWGRAWTATDLTNLRVRARMTRSSFTSGTFYLDWVSVQLTYNRQPNTPTNLRTDGVTDNPNVTNVNPVFTWIFSDPDSDAQAQSRVEVNTLSNFAGTVMWDSGWVTNNAPNNSTASATYGSGGSSIPLAFDGTTYYWRVTTRDGSGASNNTSPISAVAQFTTHSNQAPNQPTNQTPASGAYVTNGNPQFTWSAFNDPNAGDTQNARQVQLRTNSGAYGGAGSQDSGAQTGAGNTWTPGSWNLADGTYCWHVRVQDNYYAWSAYSDDTCFTKDATGPSAPTISSSTHPVEGTWYSNNNPQFSWTVPSDLSGVAGYSYVIDHNATTLPGTTINTTQNTLSLTGWADGDWYLHVRARDNAGNWGATDHFHFLIDTAPPLSRANPPAGPINIATVSIPYTATDATSGIATDGVTLYYNFGGGAYTADGTASGTSGTFVFTPVSGDGTYCFYTRATDNAGNTEAAPGTPDGCTVVKSKASIGDRIWYDTDGDGVQDPGEPGINGVTLTLTRGGSVISTTTTSGDGDYLFSNLQGWLMRTVRDNFSTASYGNNDGTASWASSWTETDSGSGGATSGNVLITGGRLNIDTGGSNISRQADLAGFANATLSFDFATSGASVDSTDAINLEVSNNGGFSWTLLEQFLGSYAPSYSGSRTYNISAYIAANTMIRFSVPSGSYSGSNETFYIDNIQIQYDNGISESQSTYTVTVDASNFDVGGALYGYQPTDGLSAMSPLVVTVAAGQDLTTADFGYGPFAVLGGVIYQDSDRNGALDSGEPGLPNITVWLYSDGNGNGKIDGTDTIVKTASTYANGVYYFGGVTAGSYLVLADVNDPDLPGAFRPTSPNPAAVPDVLTGHAYFNADIGFNTPPPVTKELYLRTPTILTRNMPTGLTPNTVQILSSDVYRSHAVTWTMTVTQALAGPLTFVNDQPVVAVLRIQSNPSASALSCGGQLPDVTLTLGVVGGATLSTAVVNDMPAGLNTRFINLNIPAGTTLPANSRLSLKIDASGADCGMNPPYDEDADGYIVVYFDALTDLSRLEMPVVSYLKIDQAGTYDAAFPGGAATPTFIQGDTVYFRVTASDPFGAFDISGATLSVPGVVTNTAMSLVSSGSLTRTFQSSLAGLNSSNYSYAMTVTEGSEGVVSTTITGTFNIIVSNLGNSTKTVDKAIAAPGDTLTYTIELSNTGGLVASVRMTDTLPANVTYQSGPTGSGSASYSAPLNAVLFNGTVPANGKVTFTYRVTVNSPLDNGAVIANNTTIADGYTRFDTSPPATTVIHSAPILSASTKSVDRATAAPGDVLVYTIVLTNTGNMNAYISSSDPLQDDIPANTAYDGGLFASAGQISFNPGFNRIEWYGTAPAGGSVTLRYRVKTAWPLDNGAVISNTAVINEGIGFPNPQTYQRTATTTIVSAPNLVSQSAKLVDKALAAPGDTLAYNIILKNSGNMNAPGVALTDVLPANTAWAGDAFMSATSGDIQYYPITRTLVWQGDMNAGLTVQILFRAIANTPLPNNTQIVNTARVSDGLGNFTPFNLTALTTIQSAPNLSASTKAVSAATASPGATLFYTLTLVNTGNAVASAILTDTLPPELQNPVLISASGGVAQIVGNQVRWSGSVTPTTNVVIAFRAALLPVLDNGTVVQNTALVNDGVNLAFYIAPAAMTTIQSSPNLNTSLKVVDRSTASPNDLLVYTIWLTNTGNMAAHSTLVRDVLPANVTFNGGLSASPGQPLPTYSSINNRVTWQGEVAPGAPVTISYQVRVNTPLDNGTVIFNDAEINDGVHTPFDTAPAAQTVITSAPDLSTSSKSVSTPTAAPGDLLHYTIRLVNTGNMIASGVTLSDVIPAEVTFASGPFVAGGGSGGWNPGQRRVFWSGSVAPGSDVIVEYYVTVNNPLPNNTNILNDAFIQSSSGSFTTNQVSTLVTSDHQLAVNKSAPSAIGAGQRMTYTIQYNVTGNEPAPGVVITDAVPANTSYVSCTGSCVQAGGLVTWTLGNLTPGNSGTLLLVVQVTLPLADGTLIVNTASIYDAENAPVSSSASTTVTSGHGFSLAKRDSPDPVQAGGTIVYSLDWSVAGTAVAQGIVITDALPANTSFVSCGGGTSCSAAGGIVTWNLPNANPGANGAVTVSVSVASPLPNGTLLTNNARIYDANGGLPTTASEQTTVQSSHSLAIAKTGPASVAAGGQITYAIYYTVTGNETAQNVTIEDTTPPNTTFASASGAGTIENPGPGNNGLVRWHLGNLTPGTAGFVTLVVNVNSPLPNGTPVVNTATIADSNGGATHESSLGTTVTSSHSFTIAKSDTPDPVSPNGLINYTIHWTVTGNEAGHNVVITDALPLHTTYATCGACVLMGSYVSWDLGDRNPGASGDAFLQVRVDTPLVTGTLVVNTARISDANNGAPVETTVNTTVNSNHQLAVTKGAPSVIQAGQPLNYSINWSVTGDEPAAGVTITDAAPANTVFAGCDPVGLCSLAGGVVTWNLGDLVPGNFGSATLVVTVSNLLPNGTVVSNTARIFDSSGRRAQATALTTVSSGHGFSLAKRDTGYDPVQAGGQVVYSLDWSMAGTEAAQSVVITDALPANTIFASCSGGLSCSQAGGIVTWNLGNQNPGALGTVNVAVTVTSPLPNGTLLTDNARISDSNGGLPTTASEQTTVQSAHVLNVVKNAPPSVSAGGQITYTIAWSVAGNETAQSVVVEDTTPANTTYASSTPVANDHPSVGSTGLVRWRLGNQPPGASGVVTLVVNVASPLPNLTPINNTANIADSNNGAPGSDSASTQVNSAHSFTLSKTDTPDPVSPDGLINYTIHWAVTGNEAAQGIIITDAIPANTAYATCGACVLMGDYVRWDIGDRNPGASGDAFLQVRVASSLVTGTIILNNARISDGNSGAPAAASASTTVQSGHQLSLNKTAPATIQAGQLLSYTINWSVTGNEPASSVVITDAVPANTTFASCGGATCSMAGGIVTWTLGDLAPGNSGAASLAVTVTSPLQNGTVIVNTANILDSSGRRAQGSASTTVTSAHSYTLSKSDAPDPVAAGGVLVYTLSWSLSGNEAATGVVITDALPANTTFSSCSNGCTQPGGVVTWNLGNQSVGAAGTVVVTVTVTSPLPNGTVLTNNARISDGNGGIPTTASAQTTVQSSHALNITKTGPAGVSAGGQITYTLRYTVTGNETAQSVTIDDNTPVNTTFASASGAGTIQAPPVGSTGLVRWQLGNLAPGASGVATLVVNVNSPLPNGTVIANSASIADSNGGTTQNSSWNTTVNSSHALTLTKSDTPDPTTPDGVINYTIHWQVTGNEAAQSIVITDGIPVNTSYSSCGACVLMGDYVRWTLGNQNPGASGDVFLQVRTATVLPNGTLITNTARISDGNGATPVQAQAVTTVQSGHSLVVSKTGPVTASPGDQIIYTIAYQVVGSEVAPDATITDAVPANTAFVSCAGCTVAGSTATWSLGTLNPGTNSSVQLTVRLNTPLSNGTLITNTATFYDSAGRRAQSTATTLVTSAPSLATSTKQVSQANAAPNDVLVYTITLRNTGNAAASGASMADTLPANTTWDSWVTQNGAALVGSNVTWTGNVTPGADVIIAFRVRINTPLDNNTVIANSATVNDNFSGHTPITLGPVQTVVHSTPNLATSFKTVSHTDARPGQVLTYTITLVNTGDMIAANALMLDEIPFDTTYVSGSASATSGAVQYQPTNNRIRWAGAVAPGANVVVTFSVRVNLPLDDGTTINNAATVEDGVHAALDTNTVTTVIHSAPGLATSGKTVDLADAAPGQLLHYVIALVNSGDMTASGAVTDDLPSQVTYVSGPMVQNGAPANWDPTARRITWRGQVVPGTNVIIEYYATARTPLDDGTVISNTATIADGVHPPFETQPALTTIHSSPDLSTSSKTVDQAVASPGSAIEYTLNLVNTGNMNAAALLTDTLPVEVSFVGGPIASSGTAVYDPASRQVRWSGAVNVGLPVTIRYTTRLDAGLAGDVVVTNTATVDDQRGHVIEIGPAQTVVGHGLGIYFTDGRATVQPGELATYTVAYSGTEPLNNGRVQVYLPAHTSFVAASAGYVYMPTSDNVFWMLAPQPPGYYGEQYLTVQLDPVLDNGGIISTTAFVAGDGRSNQATESATVVSAPSWATSAKTADRYNVQPMARLTYTIRLANTGNMHAHAASMTDPLPFEVSFVGSLTSTLGAASYDPATRRVTWNGPLEVGSPVTVTFAVTVNAGVVSGTLVANTAIVDDEVNSSTPLTPCIITVVPVEQHQYTVFMPLVLRSYSTGPQLPDLVVTGLSITPPNPSVGQPVDVAVTLKNQGNSATSACFWIDLYINPTRLPITVNKGWFEAGSEGGLVWSVCGLDIDQSITLHYDDSHYWPSYSQFYGHFQSPSTYMLYVQVDSYNSSTTYGAVYESNEANNVYGPQAVAVGGTAAGQAAEKGSTPPRRPDIPPGDR